MSTHDIIVIGAGQAGPGIASNYAAEGQRVALVEMERAGGTCLNHGCRPTKALRASGMVAHSARRASEYGVRVGDVEVDFGAAIARVHEMIGGMQDELDEWLAGVDGLEQVHGRATLVSVPDGVEHRVQVGDRELTASKVFLDIGARAAVPDIDGLDAVDYLTETELLQLTELPEHLVVIGGGYIGLEFGQMFRRFGADVTIIAGGGIAGHEDQDVQDILTKVLEGEGVRIVSGHPDKVAAGDGGVLVEVGGDTIAASHLLLATGRRSNSDLLGPDHGLATDDHGFITVDGRFATSVPGIFALGDINGRGAWTHTAYTDTAIYLDEDRTVDGRVPAYAMFTDPPLGRVGMSLEDARASGRNIMKAEVPMSGVSRAVLESETAGVMRLLVDADTEQFVGATILGLAADDVVQIVSLALQAQVPYTAVRDSLPIHPTVAEFLPTVLGSLEPIT